MVHKKLWFVVHEGHGREGIALHLLLRQVEHRENDVFEAVRGQTVEVHAGTVHLRVAQGDDVRVRASLRETVHREEVGDDLLASYDVLDDVGPNDVILWQQVMDYLILRVFVLDFVSCLLVTEQFENDRYISLLHGTHLAFKSDRLLLWQAVLAIELFETHVNRTVGVLREDQCLAIDEPVHVVACCEGRRHRVA